MPSEDDVFLQVKKWTVEERVLKRVLPHQEGVSWAIELAYPFNHPKPMPIVLLGELGFDFVSIQLKFKMEKEFILLKEKGLKATADFSYELQSMFLQKDVAYRLNIDDSTWLIVDTVFFDGLNKNELFKAIRHVHGSAILSVMMLSKAVEKAFPDVA